MAAEGIGYSVKTNGAIKADGRLHRFVVDGERQDRRNGFYILHLDARPAGQFGAYSKTGEQKFSWTAKGLKPLTREERAEMRRKAEAARVQAAAEEAARHAAARTRANATWDGAAPAPTHPYLARKNVQPYGLRVGPWVKQRRDGSTVTVCPNALLVPMVAKRGEIWGLQAIFPGKLELNGELRDKDFVYGARKKGLYHPIGTPAQIDGRDVIGFAEGYATAASVHEAIGVPVMVCFDAGNLLEVARVFRQAKPNARLVFFADNDQFTVIRNVPTNVGVIKATDAAQTVKGDVIAPWFTKEDLDEAARREQKPSDWNDLHNLRGLDEVRRQIMLKLSPPPPIEEPPAEEEPPPWTEDPYAGEVSCGSDLAPIEDRGPGADVEAHATKVDEEKPKRKRKRRDDGDGAIGNPDAIKKNGWFTILGHDRDYIYVIQHEQKMITRRGLAEWSENGFITLAPPDWWAQNFGTGGKFDKAIAVNAIVRYAFERGYYDPNSVRGRGAWLDEGRIVIHLGNRLVVDGEEMDVTEIDSNFVYEQGGKLRSPGDEAMSNADGKRIVEVAKGFHWNRPASAILCAGWVALAPLCGALRWRPHIWLTGGAGSGKSTVLNFFLWPLLNGMDVYAQGNSTEAGIRQTLEKDAMPVLFEESEQNDERERLRMQAVLALIRQSSTESAAKTLKGSQSGEAMGFMIRSMFCLASIMVGMRHQADMERISVLALKPKRTASKDQAAKNWAEIKAKVDDLSKDKGLPGRLVRRSIQLLPTTLENIEIFARAAADKFGSQRDGDQYGALLAGAWSLISTKLATEEQARAMINRYDWTEYSENTEQEESAKALQALLERQIRTPRGDVSVYELVARCAGREGGGAWDGPKESADNYLRRHGMMIKWTASKDVESAALLVANNHTELERLMAGTPYGTDLKGQLARIPGAFKCEAQRFNGTLSRSVGLPLARVLDGEDIPFAGDDFGEDIAEF